MENKGKQPHSKSYFAPLFAGAVAGVSVDVTLYPLDTLKTRLQSQQGFHKAGGFSGVYRGLLTVATTSIPTTSLFFMSYETTKKAIEPMVKTQYAPLVHMLAASVGEVLACIIRVPTEIAKQRKQTYTGSEKRSSIRILVHAFHTDGFRNGVYRGFLSTVVRDLPFSFIELPLWELFKTLIKDRNDGQITSFQMCAERAERVGGGRAGGGGHHAAGPRQDAHHAGRRLRRHAQGAHPPRAGRHLPAGRPARPVRRRRAAHDGLHGGGVRLLRHLRLFEEFVRKVFRQIASVLCAHGWTDCFLY
ncbi:S-adenosylmethionine mitochondrial carrier protein-like isoform X1 [Vanessa atalanta]|uniref:S-adenosylmethionine mitochondrial carrier protein-like isoform X1 n=1 Tax=Vanessa atalanta TaxID=42275 RepID=UPI001FCDDF5F|nr:S-adenosylmethionine mitochondrial carrier protein-like isoform X1 [Vanessa atalanta]